uniref:Integrase catalytic domain-containing protein n=1 Tax=Triticum urartu TaxID=4572 RepID=A0A8R7PEX6_TRIUA
MRNTEVIEERTVLAFFICNNGDGTENATIAAHRTDPEWILDSSASQHVAGDFSEFESYDELTTSQSNTIRTADGTSQPIKGMGTIQCTPNIKLSSVLHVPSFQVNLLSFSALINQVDCRITVDRKMCLIVDGPTGRRIGTGIRRRALWYMDREGLGQTGNPVFVAIVEERESVAMKHHCRMGHVSFDKMFKLFPDVMHGVDKNKLKCDVCEFAKHDILCKALRSIYPFMLVHSDVWTSLVVSVSGAKYFVTFIDCHSRMTWIYLMRHKDETFQCFKTFYAYVKNHFNVQVQVIRSDNGTEYVNKVFGTFLPEHGILHQTSCLDTPPQNGVAERKNRHILEVARSPTFTMNVPKFLWGEAVMAATHLINHTSSRVLGITCHLWGNWIHGPSSVSSLGTLLGSVATSVGALLNEGPL